LVVAIGQGPFWVARGAFAHLCGSAAGVACSDIAGAELRQRLTDNWRPDDQFGYPAEKSRSESVRD
jgi:hypothetical protein